LILGNEESAIATEGDREAGNQPCCSWMLEGSQRRFLNESKEISAKLVKEEGEVR
jgi:hypothetical protein